MKTLKQSPQKEIGKQIQSAVLSDNKSRENEVSSIKNRETTTYKQEIETKKTALIEKNNGDDENENALKATKLPKDTFSIGEEAFNPQADENNDVEVESIKDESETSPGFGKINRNKKQELFGLSYSFLGGIQRFIKSSYLFKRKSSKLNRKLKVPPIGLAKNQLEKAESHKKTTTESATTINSTAASSKGHQEVVELLLKCNTRIDVFDKEGRAALHLAAESGSMEGLTSLHFAANKGFTDLVDYLVNKHGATIESLTIKKQTPMHLAASSGKMETVQKLIDLEAMADFNDELDQKPIHLAAQNDHTDVVRQFLEIRPSLVSSTTKDGNTLAHLVAKKGSVDVLQAMFDIDTGLVTNAKNRFNENTNPFGSQMWTC